MCLSVTHDINKSYALEKPGSELFYSSYRRKYWIDQRVQIFIKKHLNENEMHITIKQLIVPLFCSLAHEDFAALCTKFYGIYDKNNYIV